MLYFLGSWIKYDRGESLPNQALLIDLPNRKAFFFNIEIWPDDIYYIAALMIIAALGLFFVTSIYGRIWCGYGCPHTVFVDIFIKIEAYFQGDRNQRILLDKQPLNKLKFIKKFLTYLSWFGVSFLFAFGWVCYFYGSDKLVKDIFKNSVGTNAFSWLTGLTLSTMLFAGFLRSKVCTFMCPYGRFQSAMIDNDTSVVTYDYLRGEIRGKQNLEINSPSDCIDCGKCVIVCPMGIDIRDGLQMECIGCGLCIDACNTVMQKIGKKEDLISYKSTNHLHSIKRYNLSDTFLHKLKVIIFLTIIAVMISVLLYMLSNKPPLIMSIASSRISNGLITPDGKKRYDFLLKIYNKTSHDKMLTLKIESNEKIELKINKPGNTFKELQDVNIKASEEIELEVFLKMALTTPTEEFKNLNFILKDIVEGKAFIQNLKLKTN